MIKLKSLIKEERRHFPDKSLAQFLLTNHVELLSDWLYHGSPPEGLVDILINGIYGIEHGEVSENETFSTSVNSEVLGLFSEMHGDTGLQFRVEGVRVLVLDDVMAYLATALRGSGMELEADETKPEQFVKRFNIPVGEHDHSPYLPYDYITSLGVDAFTYDYVWSRVRRGMTPSVRDESEICFVGKGIDLLNRSISGIWVDGHEYEPSEKAEALKDLQGRV